MVCLSSRSPNGDALLRKGARLADRLDAPWYAVYIQTPGEKMEKVDAATQRQIGITLELAHKLGGVPLTFKGNDVVSTVAAFAKEYSITCIVLGRSRQPWYRRVFGQSILDRLLHDVSGVDVVVVDTD
jgi:two-component system sensor histidine kinase KdpD